MPVCLKIDQELEVNSDQNPSWLGYIRAYTTQLYYSDYNEPL